MATVLAVALAGCSRSSGGTDEPALGPSHASAQAPSPTPTSSTTPAVPAPSTRAPADAGACSDPVPVFRDGRPDGRVCPERAAEQGLTIVDLSDDFAPFVFRAPRGHEEVEYRATYVALADEQDVDEDGNQVADEPYLELFGVFPTFRVHRTRLADDTIARCHAGIDDTPLDRFAGVLRRSGPEATNTEALSRNARAQRTQLEREAARRSLPSIDALGDDPRYGAQLTRLREAEGLLEIIATMQKHLACEGLLPRYREGIFDTVTSRALTMWQRKNMLVSRGYFDEHSRNVMKAPYDERLFLGVLRTLRERVVDATGLIEDGTASARSGTVVGRHLNAPELEATHALGALPNGAPDLISAATDAAAKALGLTDPEAARAFLRDHPTRRLRVALPLPPPPDYHTPQMELRAEIDRGDVRRGRNQPGDRRPTTTVYVRANGRDIPLVRWSTTIGGYQDERLEDGTIVTRYKESPAGERIWRDVVAAPAWLPPPTTPDDDLVGRAGRVNRALMGPSYRSAYGLLMVMHHKVLPPGRDGLPRFQDEGVRSHGSVSYHSMLSGFSHGCHRLFNHLALRLGAFLVRHRAHAVRGNQDANYSRVVVINEAPVSVHVESRGYLYELTPPVPVNVLEGTVHGRR